MANNNKKNLTSHSTNSTTNFTTPSSSTSTITATTIIKNDSSASTTTTTNNNTTSTNIINTQQSTIIKSPLHNNKQSKTKILTKYESRLNDALHKFTEIDYNNNGITNSTTNCCCNCCSTPMKKKNENENNQDLNLIAHTASTFNRDSIYVVDNENQASIIIHHHHFEKPNQNSHQSPSHIVQSRPVKYNPNQHKVIRNSQYYNKQTSSNFPCNILTGGNSNDDYYYSKDSRNYNNSSNSRNFNHLNINNNTDNSTVYAALSSSTVTSKTMIFRRILGI